MKRNIIHIDEDKCNGCGLCVNACHEGAIAMIDGKAKLVSDKYCDGLGNCLPECPTGAISIIEREADAFDEEAVKEKMTENQAAPPVKPMACGCPGTMAKSLERKPTAPVAAKPSHAAPEGELLSELRQWPVQLKLINPDADYLEGADLLLAADCCAYAYADFHRDFIKGRIAIIECPKLDDQQYYNEKLADIIKRRNISSITVVRMEVPCCGGIVDGVKRAMLAAGKIVPYREVTIGIDGQIVKDI